MVTARAFPALIASTIPGGAAPVGAIFLPADPDIRVITLLCVAAVFSALLVTLAPATRNESRECVKRRSVPRRPLTPAHLLREGVDAIEPPCADHSRDIQTAREPNV